MVGALFGYCSAWLLCDPWLFTSFGELCLWFISPILWGLREQLTIMVVFQRTNLTERSSFLLQLLLLFLEIHNFLALEFIHRLKLFYVLNAIMNPRAISKEIETSPFCKW